MLREVIKDDPSPYVKYIEYIEELFSVSYTRFYIEQQCAHADDDFIDDDY